MAIQPFVRIQNRLTDKNFADAEQLDFEFNNFTEYLNSKILPVLNTLFDMQVLASNIPADINCYLYEDENGLLVWRKPESVRTLLPLLEPPPFNIAILGKKRYTEHLDWYSIEYVEDGVLIPKTTSVFSIQKLDNNFFENDLFQNSNFLDNSINQNKIFELNDATEIDEKELAKNHIIISQVYSKSKMGGSSFSSSFYQRFDPQNGFLSFDCIKNGSLINTEYASDTRSYGILRGLPAGVYGAGNLYQLQEYIPRLNRVGVIDDTTINTLDDFLPFPQMSQLLSEPSDLMTGSKFRDESFSVFFLSITQTTSKQFGYNRSMKIPPRCFADKSIGISGVFYDEKVFAGQPVPERVFRSFPRRDTGHYGGNYDINNASMHPTTADSRICYYVDNLLTPFGGINYYNNDIIEDGIIDIDFFPKKIQDKIRARL